MDYLENLNLPQREASISEVFVRRDFYLNGTLQGTGNQP